MFQLLCLLDEEREEETRAEDLDLLGLGLDRVLDIFPPELQKEVLDLYLEKRDRSGKFCCSFNNNLLWFRYMRFTKCTYTKARSHGLVVKADGL